MRVHRIFGETYSELSFEAGLVSEEELSFEELSLLSGLSAFFSPDVSPDGDLLSVA
jgi:hypothetical protein